MSEECCEIKVVPTEDGIRIDITGEGIKNAAGCCVQADGKSKKIKINCCDSEVTADCCGSDVKEKKE